MSQADANRQKNWYSTVFLYALVGLAFTIPIFSFIDSIIHPPEKQYSVSRAKGDMRSLATAIEAYFVDNSAYPPHTYPSALKTEWHTKSEAPTFDQRISLSTPVAYIPSLPLDVFHPDREISKYAFWAEPQNSSFAYWSTGRGWVLVSKGPDKDFDVDFREFERTTFFFDPENPDILKRDEAGALQYFLERIYNPTNGSLSNGDIFHFASGALDVVAGPVQRSHFRLGFPQDFPDYVPPPEEDAE